MCARSQTSGDISRECCRTSSPSSSASVSTRVRALARSRSATIRSLILSSASSSQAELRRRIACCGCGCHAWFDPPWSRSLDGWSWFGRCARRLGGGSSAGHRPRAVHRSRRPRPARPAAVSGLRRSAVAASCSVRSAARPAPGRSAPNRAAARHRPSIGAQASTRLSAAAASSSSARDDRGRHRPPVARLRVDVPDLEVPPRSDLRKQGGQVVGEVVGGGRRRSGTAARPRRSHVRKVRPAGAVQDPAARRTSISGASSAQRARRPARSSPGLRCRHSGAGRVELQPDGLSGALPAGRPAGAAGRVGEGGDQRGTDRVQQIPAVGGTRQRVPASPRRPVSAAGATPASTLTCTEAVEHIMVRPAGPQPSK